VHCSGIVIAVFDGRVDDCGDRNLKRRLYHIEDKQILLPVVSHQPNFAHRVVLGYISYLRVSKRPAENVRAEGVVILALPLNWHIA